MDQGAANAPDNLRHRQGEELHRCRVDAEDAMVCIEDHDQIIDGVKGGLPFFGGRVEMLRELLPFRDVANHPKNADHASGGGARGDRGQVMDPLLTLGRMEVAILDIVPLARPLIQLLPLRQHALAVIRMQPGDPQLQPL